MFQKLIATTTLALLAASAGAADLSPVYVAGDIGRTNTDAFDARTSYGASLGYRLNPTFSVEGGVRRLGKGTLYYNNLDIDTTADQFALSVVATGFAQGEFSNFGTFARAGYNRLRAQACHSNVCASESETKFMFGAGFVYAFSERVFTRLEWQRPVKDTSNVSLSLIYNF